MTELSKEPPYGNTGAQNTMGETLRALVDWVAATFMTLSEPDLVFALMGLEKEQFVQMEYGEKGYNRQYRCGHIVVLMDGKTRDKDGNEIDMGVNVEMTGQGCREFETLSTVNWINYFIAVLAYGHFTRLDIAVDDFKGYFKISRLYARARAGLSRSKFKKARNLDEFWISDGTEVGRTLYFGKGSSEIQIRFYDKAAQLKNQGKELEEGIVVWNRTEIQSRRKRADMLAIYIVNGGELGVVARGVLSHYVTFIEKGTDKNKARWPISPFWQKFLDDVKPLRLTLIAPDRTIDRIHKWVDNQVSKSMGMLFLASNSNIDIFIDWINKGIENMNKTDHHIVELHLAAATKAADEKIQYDKEFWDEKKKAASFGDETAGE